MKTIYRTLGERVREERKRAKLSLEQLARMAGISTSFLAYIERGERQARLETIAQLANALLIPIGDLFTPTSQPPRDEASRAAQEFALLIRGRSRDEMRMLLEIARAVLKIAPPPPH